MWWADARSSAVVTFAPSVMRRSVIVGVFALAGCGFEPLYGERAASFDPELAAVRVEPIPERVGQLLAISLRDGFNPTGQRVETKYTLLVTLASSRREIAIRRDATASRLQVELSAGWGLRDPNGRTILNGSSRSVTSFDISDNEYANLVAEQDARARLVRDISEDIRLRVRAYLTGRDRAA